MAEGVDKLALVLSGMTHLGRIKRYLLRDLALRNRVKSSEGAHSYDLSQRLMDI